MKKDLVVRNFIIGTFVLLYTITSVISTIHVIDFFALTNPHWLAVSLAIAFEVGAAASLAAIIILDKTSKSLVWFLFILLTLMQMMGNMAYAYNNAHDYQNWMELFALNEEDIIFQKRILAIISGAILPIVSLGFIKSLVDYIRPSTKEESIQDKTNMTIATEIIPVQEMAKPDLSIYVKPTTVEDIDEEEILKESSIKEESSNLESVATHITDNFINEIEELNKVEESVKDAKREAIEEVNNEMKDNNRKFGPPHIN